MCLHASWMSEAQCTRCTPLPKPVKLEGEKKKPKRASLAQGTKSAIHTERLVIDADTQKMLDTMSVDVGDCGGRLFSADPGRAHLTVVDVDGQAHGVSVRRVAWVLAHPGEQVADDEMVRPTCGNIGHPSSGDGCCITHLQKVSSRTGGALCESSGFVPHI